ncbi:hypothetical protein ACE6H2_002602 [Prunus campanulata]
MASLHRLTLLLRSVFLTQFSAGFSTGASIKATLLNPICCSAKIMTCNASLYHINSGLKKEKIASFYSVYPSEIKPIKHNSKQDYLISVPCSCKNISGTVGYFYETTYKVKPSDTFYNVSAQIYSGQPLSVKEELPKFVPEADFPIHLPCGCVESDYQIVATYTVQEHDTVLSDIGTLLSAKIDNIKSMNKYMTENPCFLAVGFASDASINATFINPLSCSAKIMTCNASLYHINISLNKEQIASLYSVFPSEVNPIKHNSKQDYLVSVPCSCKNISGTVGYFYDTTYKVKPSDTFYDVSNQIYSGQPLSVKEELKKFVPGADFPIHLPCGCVESDSQIVVTYTVQEHDTLSDIGTLLSAKIDSIENMNKNMIEDPSFIVVGWVLFVPMEKNGLKTSKTGEFCFRLLD